MQPPQEIPSLAESIELAIIQSVALALIALFVAIILVTAYPTAPMYLYPMPLLSVLVPWLRLGLHAWNEQGLQHDLRRERLQSGIATYRPDYGAVDVDADTYATANSRDLSEFVRRVWVLGESHGKHHWTGDKARKKLPSKRSLSYEQWNSILIQPCITAKLMTVSFDDANRRHTAPNRKIQYSEAIERLRKTGYIND